MAKVFIPELSTWTQYARDVISGAVPAGQYIKLEAQRMMDWFERDDIFFNFEMLDKMEMVINRMKHFEGHFAGKPFVLLPFQKFVIANIFGWYYKDEPEKRVREEILMLISRKNAKTALSAAILLCDMIVGKSPYYQAYLAATTRDQAKICHKFIKGYAKSLDPSCKLFSVFRDRVTYSLTNAVVQAVSKEASTLDGLNPDAFIIDEMHAMKDDDMYQVLASGQASKLNPLRIIISSGGYLMDGFPFYERIQSAHRMLSGEVDYPDNKFFALFELDPEDDWEDEKNWIKANPSLGEIVQMRFLKERARESQTNMATQTDFKIKNLDIFVTAKNIWLPPAVLDPVMVNLDLEQLREEPCWMGVDLSSVNDLTAVGVCWPPNDYREYYPDKYIFTVMAWVPQAALESENAKLYDTWIRSGFLQLTSGNSVDYQEILYQVMKWNDKFPINKIFYDEWNASSWTQQAIANGLPMQAFSQTLGSFNRPTKALEVMIRNQQCVIHATPLLRWAFGNCELKFDSYGNTKPVKAQDNPTKKIDPVIALTESLAAYLFEQLFSGSEVVELEYS